MTMIKWKPQRHGHGMMNDFDRLWSDFFPRHAHGHAHGCGHGASCDWSPRVDIVENDKSYQLVVEVPGFEKSEVKLSVEDKVLTLSGERKFEGEQDDKSFRRVERLYGNFERRFRLPEEAETDGITAELKNGILTVTIAKSEKVAGREIEVK